jgi:TrmH family RNA methyltransferase
MLSKSTIKMISSLEQKKFRNEHKLFVVEGVKMFEDLLSSRFAVHSVYCLQNFFDDHEAEFEPLNFAPNIVTEDELKKISFLTTPNEVLALVEMERDAYLSIEKNELALVLDDIKDPGNLGTIIRIADWFDIKTIICSKHTADFYNPKVVQATMGSLFRVELHYRDLVEFLNQLRDRRVYGCVMDGEDLYGYDIGDSGFIVIGNESAGISDQVQKCLTDRLTIPRYSSSEIDSLNAGIASALVCSEFRRRFSF